MPKKINLVGKRFGRLVVVSEHGKTQYGVILWECKCDCGNTIYVVGQSLRSGATKSCGCLQKELISKKTKKDIVGDKYGKLTVIKRYGSDEDKRILWECKCDCGNTCVVSGKSLRSGNTKSCGCLAGRPQVVKICPVCGKEFRVKQACLDRGCGKYCSVKCMGIDKRGDKNILWKGGVSFGKYCEKFNKTKKEEIRAKYGRVCFICGKNEEENGRKLDVHHVDYSKNQGCDGNKWALIPLCKSCHAKTGNNRSVWNAILSHKIAYYHTTTKFNYY
jgi:hypothetical protein